jgi:hypothetical protein
MYAIIRKYAHNQKRKTSFINISLLVLNISFLDIFLIFALVNISFEGV